jgi:hypothetical protein
MKSKGRRPKKQIATKRYRVRSTIKGKEKDQESLEERPERTKAKEGDGQEGVSSLALVAHACNPSYSGGRDQEGPGSKPVQANSSKRPYLEKPFTKIKLKMKALS